MKRSSVDIASKCLSGPCGLVFVFVFVIVNVIVIVFVIVIAFF